MIAPVDISDAVELWARQRGRHGRMEWVPRLEVWVIHLDLPADAPQMRAYQEGNATEKPTEPVYLMEWDTSEHRYVGLRLDDLGVGGVVELLEKGDVMSGRGEHKSLMDAVLSQLANTKRQREENRKKVREMGEAMGDLTRRHFLDLPLVSVPANVTPITASEES